MDEIYDSITAAVLAAVNAFPGLADGERFAFASLSEDGGLAVFPGTGEIVQTEQRFVTGKVRRVCRLPFSVAYRAGGAQERQRENAAAWLDALGRWLEGQAVSVEGRDHCLAAYPALTDRRRLMDIRRSGPPHQADRPADRTQTWVMEMTARYENIL